MISLALHVQGHVAAAFPHLARDLLSLAQPSPQSMSQREKQKWLPWLAVPFRKGFGRSRSPSPQPALYPADTPPACDARSPERVEGGDLGTSRVQAAEAKYLAASAKLRELLSADSAFVNIDSEAITRSDSESSGSFPDEDIDIQTVITKILQKREDMKQNMTLASKLADATVQMLPYLRLFMAISRTAVDIGGAVITIPKPISPVLGAFSTIFLVACSTPIQRLFSVPCSILRK